MASLLLMARSLISKMKTWNGIKIITFDDIYDQDAINHPVRNLYDELPNWFKSRAWLEIVNICRWRPIWFAIGDPSNHTLVGTRIARKWWVNRYDDQQRLTDDTLQSQALLSDCRRIHHINKRPAPSMINVTYLMPERHETPRIICAQMKADDTGSCCLQNGIINT